MELLETYCQATGSVLNHNKTRGIHINHPIGVKLECPFPVQWNQLDTKILGIYFTPEPLLNQSLNWDKIKKNIKTRATFLSARNLSIRGKAILANTLLLSKAWLVGRIYPPPTRITKKIHKTIFEYIWNKGHEPIAREPLFRPVTEGGIGLLNLEEQCAALQILDISTVDSPNTPP